MRPPTTAYTCSTSCIGIALKMHEAKKNPKGPSTTFLGLEYTSTTPYNPVPVRSRLHISERTEHRQRIDLRGAPQRINSHLNESTNGTQPVKRKNNFKKNPSSLKHQVQGIISMWQQKYLFNARASHQKLNPDCFLNFSKCMIATNYEGRGP